MKLPSSVGPRAPAPAAAPQRTRLLSGVTEASVDVRKACNAVKRMASLEVASIASGVDTKRLVDVAEKMANDVLVSIGFDVSDRQRLESVLPMMMEATSLILADAARHADDAHSAEVSLSRAATFGLAVLSDVAKSRVVARMVEPAYPNDMDAVVALRLSASAAMALVAVEVAEFDFAHSAGECIRVAGRTVVKAAMDVSATLAPAQASPSAKLMLTQSLIHSASRVYAAAWRAVSFSEMQRLDALDEPSRESSLDTMAAAPVASLLSPVDARFVAVFAGIAETAREMFTSPPVEQAPAVRAPAARPR